MSTNQLIIEKLSPFNVPDTIEKLVSAATKKDWQNPATHNLQQSLAKSGKEVRPVQILEICKPEYSGKLLEKNHERIASVLMPCRISVYEKVDGKTYVSFINISAMISELPASIVDTMKSASEETTDIINSALEQS